MVREGLGRKWFVWSHRIRVCLKWLKPRNTRISVRTHVVQSEIPGSFTGRKFFTIRTEIRQEPDLDQLKQIPITFALIYERILVISWQLQLCFQGPLLWCFLSKLLLFSFCSVYLTYPDANSGTPWKEAGMFTVTPQLKT